MANELTEKKPNFLKKFYGSFEYEIVVFIFLILRFFFKYVTNPFEYFTQGHIITNSDSVNIAVGMIILVIISFILAVITGSIIRKFDDDERKPLIVLAAFFYACPSTLPYLFSRDTDGMSMLIPFFLFAAIIFAIDVRFVKWITPIGCFAFFMKLNTSNDNIFVALNKYSLIYVFVIIMILIAKCFGAGETETAKGKKKKANTSQSGKVENIALLVVSVVASAISYGAFFVQRGSNFQVDKLEYLNAFGTIGLGLLVCLPAVIVLGFIWVKAIKNGLSAMLPVIALVISIAVFPMMSYQRMKQMWVVLFILIQFAVIFVLLKKKNTAVYNAVADIEKFFSDKLALLLILLMVMASFSNVSSDYISSWFQRMMNFLPF